MTEPNGSNRRDFLKSSTAVVGGAVATQVGLLSTVHAAGTDGERGAPAPYFRSTPVGPQLTRGCSRESSNANPRSFRSCGTRLSQRVRNSASRSRR